MSKHSRSCRCARRSRWRRWRPRRSRRRRSRSSSPSAPAASPASTTRSAARSAGWSTRTAQEHGIRCSVESTGGSAFNVNTIKAGELDFGMAQSDVQYNAAKGLGQFKDAGAYADLRSVYSVHPEPFTVLARKELNVDQVRGPQGQALQRRQPRLRHARLDGRAARRAGLEDLRLLARLRAQGRRARPGAVRQQDRRLLLRRRPPLGQHPGPDHDLRRQAGVDQRAGGRQAASPASPTTPRPPSPAACTPTTRSRPRPTACWRRSSPRPRCRTTVVYQLVKATFDNFEEFKKLHPAFANLKPEEMVKNGLSAPLHAGRREVLQGKGLDEVTARGR